MHSLVAATFFHQHVRVGRLAFTRGGKSGFGKDIPVHPRGYTNSIIGLNLPGCAARDSPSRSVRKSKRHSSFSTERIEYRQAMERAAEMEWSQGGASSSTSSPPRKSAASAT